MSRFKRSLGTSALGIAIFTAVALSLGPLSATQAQGKDRASSEAVASLKLLSDAFATIAEDASQAVVFITVEKTVQPQQMSLRGQIPPDFFRRFFGPSAPNGQNRFEQLPQTPHRIAGQGSGFIISSDGYIVTNHHVVGDADKVSVVLADGHTLEAEIVGSDPATDIAVIKVDDDNLPSVPLADSDEVRIGEWVLAIGSPFGLSHSVTSGIVSARGRGNVGITSYPDFIQTDAAINPGNSGGPLLNLDGEVIGVNTAILSRSGGSQGIGFAIPMNMAKFIVDQIREHGTITRGFLGVVIQNLTPDLAKSFGANDGQGILVADVAEDSPAKAAGIETGDVIVEFAAQPVDEIGSFRSRVASTPAGAKIDIALLRDGQRIEKSITIGARETEQLVARNGSERQESLGFGVQDLTPGLAQEFGIEPGQGVIVTQVAPGSPAARAGLTPGTVIREADRKPVGDSRSFAQHVDDSDKSTVLLLIERNGARRFVALPLE